MGSIYDQARVALHGIWQRRWLALGVAWGIALLGWLAISLIPNRYESQARILVNTRTLLPDSASLAGDRQQSVDAVRQSLTSTVNLAKVVRGTDLASSAANDRDVNDIAAGLSKNIKVVAEQDNLFLITASSGDGSRSDNANAKLARQIVQKLIDTFVDGSLAGSRGDITETLKFLDAQLDTRGKALADAEAKRSAFDQKYMALLPGTGSIADRIAAARSEMQQIDMQLVSAQSALAAVNGQLASTPASTRTPGVMVGGAPSATAGIEAQIADGRARGWTDQHPDMVALRNQLGRTRGSGGGGAHMTPGTVTQNPMYTSLRSMQAERQATAGALSSRKAQLQGQINGVIAAQTSDPQVSTEQTRLDRDYEVLKGQYDKLLQDREEAKLRGSAQTETDAVKFSVIDPPTAPKVPATPNRPLLLTLALLAGLGGGLGAAFALDQLQGSFSTPEKLARASGLPVLGAIHQVVRDDEIAGKQKKFKQLAGGAAGLVGLYVVLLMVEFIRRSMVA